jgi:hypothetical protein
MRWAFTALLGVANAMLLSAPVWAATETPETTAPGLPVALAIVVIAGLLVFAYFLVRPSRLTGRKD